MTGFEQLGEELIHEGPVFRVTIGQVRSPDGEVLTREYVRHPGAVVVVPIVDGDVVLVRQYRAAIDRDLLEIPAGKRDVPGEPPAETAARELREEVGLVAGSLTPLTEFFNTPGFSDEYSYAFLATDCTEVEMEPIRSGSSPTSTCATAIAPISTSSSPSSPGRTPRRASSGSSATSSSSGSATGRGRTASTTISSTP